MKFGSEFLNQNLINVIND